MPLVSYLSFRFDELGLSFKINFLISVTWIGIIMLSRTDFADSRIERFRFRMATAEVMSPDIFKFCFTFKGRQKLQLFGPGFILKLGSIDSQHWTFSNRHFESTEDSGALFKLHSLLAFDSTKSLCHFIRETLSSKPQFDQNRHFSNHHLFFIVVLLNLAKFSGSDGARQLTLRIDRLADARYEAAVKWVWRHKLLQL